MDYALKAASDDDREWLDTLRREAYRELFDATWGGWDEARHLRHFSESWNEGHISIILVDESPAGMIQLLHSANQVEISEIQILPVHQNRGLGSKILEDLIASSRLQTKPLLLSLGLKNVNAFRLYQRLGFKKIRQSDTHMFMEYGSS